MINIEIKINSICKLLIKLYQLLKLIYSKYLLDFSLGNSTSHLIYIKIAPSIKYMNESYQRKQTYRKWLGNTR